MSYGNTVTKQEIANREQEHMQFPDGTVLRRNGNVYEILEGSPVLVEIRAGDYVNILGGKPFYFEDFKSHEVDYKAIAHSLSNQCRWNGWTIGFYSVAQHAVYVSVRVFQLAIEAGYSELEALVIAFYALRHDDSEAFLGDIVTPLKKMLPEYSRIEKKVQDTIISSFRIPLYPLTDVYKDVIAEADMDLLFMERDALFEGDIEPYIFEDQNKHISIRDGADRGFFCWDPEYARSRYIKMFEFFTKRIGKCTKTLPCSAPQDTIE